MESSPMVIDQRLHTVRMSLLYRLIHILNTIPSKVPAGLFCRNWWANLKIHMEMQRTLNDQNNLKKKKQVGGFSLHEWNQVS